MSNISAISWDGGENKLHSMKIWCIDDVHFVLDQHTLLYVYSTNSLKQQSVRRHVAPLGHIILITNQPVFALNPYNAACLAEKKQIPILLLVWPKPGLEPNTTLAVWNIRCNFHIQLLLWLAYSLQVWEIMTFILVYDQLLQKIYIYTLVFGVHWSLVLCVCLD